MKFLSSAIVALFAFSAHAADTTTITVPAVSVTVPSVERVDALDARLKAVEQKVNVTPAPTPTPDPVPPPVPTPLPAAAMPAPGTYAHGYFINNDGVYDFAGISLSNTVQHYTTESIAAGFPSYNGWGYDDKATVLVDGSIGLGAQKFVKATIRNFKSTADLRSTYDTQAAIRVDGLGGRHDRGLRSIADRSRHPGRQHRYRQGHGATLQPARFGAVLHRRADARDLRRP